MSNGRCWVTAALAAAGLSGLCGFALTGLAAADSLPSNCSQPAGSALVTCTFNFTGSAQDFTVPARVTSITVEAFGAAGGDGSDVSPHAAGGLGADVRGTLAVAPSEVLQVNVGGEGGTEHIQAGGWNGGGSASDNPAEAGRGPVGGGGGGASDIRDGSDMLADRLLVAAGGGGGGGNGDNSLHSSGGAGGASGTDGTAATPAGGEGPGGPGLAGTSTAGGTAGSGGHGSGFPGGTGTDGKLGTGGGGALGTAGFAGGGGGGGGGYFGGGGGGGGSGSGDVAAGGGGGGGGSDFTDNATNVTVTDGVQSGDGQVTITYTVPPPPADLAITSTATPNPVTAGQHLTYTLTATNAGGLDATGTIVTDTLPASTQIDSVIPSQGTCPRGTSVTCDLGTLAAGGHATVTVVTTPTVAGTINATANVTADGVTADDDDTATASMTVTAPPVAPPPLVTAATPTAATAPAAPTAPAEPTAPAAATTPVAQPAVAPLIPPVTISGIELTSATITWCRHCTYPGSRLTFNLSAKADVRLALMAKIHGHWTQVAATTVHGHRGHNSFRVGGRWHGQLVPHRVTRILVHIRPGATWTIAGTLELAVHSPYTTRILNRR